MNFSIDKGGIVSGTGTSPSVAGAESPWAVVGIAFVIITVMFVYDSLFAFRPGAAPRVDARQCAHEPQTACGGTPAEEKRGYCADRTPAPDAFAADLERRPAPAGTQVACQGAPAAAGRAAVTPRS